MKKIATVNGVKVYSDKKMTSMVNDTVNFSDGSYVNVSTGSVVNKGPGSISINTPGENQSNELTKKGPEEFNASSLNIKTFGCKIIIEPWDKETIELSGEGEKHFIEELKTSIKKDTLYITSESKGSNISVSSSNGGSVVVSGGNISIKSTSIFSRIFGGKKSSSIVSTSSSSDNTPNSITLKVPIYTTITIDGSSQEISIGDVDGNLELDASGQSECFIGSMKNTSVSISGQSEASVSDVHGSLSLQTSGQSSITVKSGTVTNLTAQSSGQSDIVANVQADNANVSASGQSDITVTHVKNKPQVSSSGMSDVTIKNW